MLASQAGETVRCTCGQTLEVPTLRGLRELATDAPTTPVRRREWEDRHRTAFLCLLLSAAALVAAGYLAMRRAPALVSPTSEAIEDHFETASYHELLAALATFEKGIAYEPPARTQLESHLNESRRLSTWGIAIALGLAGCGIVAAGVALLTPARARR